MGRIAVYDEVVSEMRTELQDAFVDLGHKRAFDLLMKGWDAERPAMANSTLPTVCDKINLVSSVCNRKLTSELSNEIRIRGTRVADLAERIRLIEEKLL